MMDPSPGPSALRVWGTPRWVTLTVVAVVATLLCVMLAWWQGSRTRDIVNAERAALSAPIQVQDALTADGVLPNSAIGRPVTVTGTFVPGSQRIVINRILLDESGDLPGAWVVANVEVGQLAVPVLRGWVPDAEAKSVSLPTETVTITGVLQPYERFYTERTPEPGEPLIAITADAVQVSPEVAGGFVTLQSQQPMAAQDPIPVPPTVQTADAPFPIQNIAYTLQWLVFAGVVWFIFGRWLRLDVLRARDAHDSLNV